MADETPDTAPPMCPRDNIVMRPTTRVMRSHGLQAGKAIPHDKTVDVWRCPLCGREEPRQ